MEGVSTSFIFALVEPPARRFNFNASPVKAPVRRKAETYDIVTLARGCP